MAEEHGDGEGGGVEREQRVHREVAGVREQFVGRREVVRHAVGELGELLHEEPEVIEAPDGDGLPPAVEHLVEVRGRGEGEPHVGAGPRRHRPAGAADRPCRRRRRTARPCPARWRR